MNESKHHYSGNLRENKSSVKTLTVLFVKSPEYEADNLAYIVSDGLNMLENHMLRCPSLEPFHI